MRKTLTTAMAATLVAISAPARGADLTLDLSAGSDCVTSLDTVTVTLSMANLAGSGLNLNQATGFQAFLSYPSAQLLFVSATYTSTPFGLAIISGANINPSPGLIDLAAGINQVGGQSPSSADALLVTITFTPIVANDCTNSVAFRLNTPATGITDINGNLASPLILTGAPNIAIDNTAPVISALPGPTKIQCPALPSFATPTATDACDPAPSLSFADVTTPGACPQESSVTRTWTAMDACGNSSMAAQTIAVSDDTAPVISALPGLTKIQCPALPSFTTPTATDACDPAPSLSFADVTTPGACPQESSVTRTWTAMDACGNSSMASQTIAVSDDTAPVISALPGPTKIQCPALPSFTTPTATDACDPAPSLSFADVTTPGACPQESSVTRTWTAMDACGNSSMAAQTIAVSDDTAPVISALPGPTKIQCPALPSFTTPTATDACDPAPSLSFADVTTPGACPQESSVTRTWTAMDACGNSSMAAQTIAVSDDTAPVISALPGPTKIQCPALPSFTTPTATDACDPAPSLSFADVTTPGACPQESSVTRTWTAMDACGNSSMAAQTIAVSDDTAPVISALPGLTKIQCPALPSFTTPTATDACDPAPSLSFADVTTQGACPQESSVTRTWTAMDACGNSSMAAQTIAVSDDTAPVISALPGPTKIQCPALPSFTTPTATDACDPAPSLSFADVTTPGACPQESSVTRTWTAMDACGNSSMAAQTIAVSDDTAPVISALPGLTKIQCPALPSFTTPTATDACDPAPSLSFADVTTPGACPQESSVTRTWTAMDACGNSSMAAQTIAVSDDTAPVISALPGLTKIQCPALPSFTTPTATDACDPAPSLSFADVTTPGACPQESSVTRTWTAMDACGNSSMAAQTIAVSDDTAPVISALPGLTKIQCPALPSFTTPTATDACDPAPSLSFADVTTPGACPQESSVTRTWTAMDACGNSSMAAQTIAVSDDTAPVISALPGLTKIQCPALPSFTTPTATDACDPAPSLSFADVTTPGACPQESSVTRTWTAMDACGNSSMASQTIAVSDDTAPVISALPGLTKIQCPALPSFTTPTATDACDPAPSLSFADVTTPGACPQESSVTRTWTAMDACGNSSMAAQTIAVSDDTAPVVTGCPAIVSQNADAGGCTALVAWTAPTATDACDPSPTVMYDIDLDDDTIVDATIPATTFTFLTGTHRVTVVATDACGNVDETCEFTVTVAPFNTLVAAVQLAGGVASPLTRCITFGFCSGGSLIEVTEDVVFTGGSGTATLTMDVPCGSYSCMTARDELHTLRRNDSDGDFMISGTNYVADFTSSGTTDDSLVGGNLNDDDFIDIIDFGIFAGQFGDTPDGDTPCGTSPFHADISGNGTVFTEDFTFIGNNFLEGSEANCACPLSGGHLAQIAPVVSISVEELVAMGLARATAGDLNGDGWVDLADIAAFMAGARPVGPVAISQKGGDWNDSSTWTGSTPDAETNVVLSFDVVVGGLGAAARDILVTSGGGLTVNGGSLVARTVTVRAGATLSLHGESSLLSVESLVLDPGATLSWDGGVIEIAGGVYTQADLDLVVGDTPLISTLRLLENAQASIARDTYLGMDAGDAGVLEVDGGRFATGRSLLTGFGGNGWLEIRAGGVVSATDASVGVLPGGMGDVLVDGAAARLDVGRRLAIGEMGQGLLVLSAGGVAAAGDAIVIGPRGAVTGEGVLEGATLNQGLVAPSGALRIAGSYEQHASGELVVELRGDGHDVLLVDGQASLGGALRINLGAGYVAQPGASHELVIAGARAGEFETILLPALGSAMYFDVIHTPGGVRLVVTETIAPVGAE